MFLHLECRNYGITLDLPATPNDVASTIFDLIAGFENEPVQVKISGVNSPIPSLYPYIQHADLECGDDLQKLNTLAEQIGSMTQEEQRLFSGALELECTGGLDGAIRIAGGLERYEIFPKIKTDEDLGRFLVDTAFMTGKFSFPKEARFLGYDIYVRRSNVAQKDKNGRKIRFLSGTVCLELPMEIMRKKLLEYGAMTIEKTVYGKENWRARARYYLKNNDPLEILDQYNSEIRGFRNYYRIANNSSHPGNA